MARIVIVNLFKKQIEVGNLSKSLLQHFHDNHLDWMHACGGKGRCTSCKAIILKGAENIVRLTPAEIRYKDLGLLADNERLCCQARITGDVELAAPEEYKLPHLQYSDLNGN
jgi:ferredoxin, 2Fe-2S